MVTCGTKEAFLARTADETEAAHLEELVARIGHRLNELNDAERFQVVHAVVRRIVVRSKTEIELLALVPSGEHGQYTSTAWQQQVLAHG